MVITVHSTQTLGEDGIEKTFTGCSSPTKRRLASKRMAAFTFLRVTLQATIMITNDCDIRIVKGVLRHNDIRTTLRYAHVADKTKRARYEQYSLVIG